MSDPGFVRDARILRELAARGVIAGLPGVLDAVEVLIARGRRETAQALLEAVAEAEVWRRAVLLSPQAALEARPRVWAPMASRLVAIAAGLEEQ
jgi:hypothetical protein